MNIEKLRRVTFVPVLTIHVSQAKPYKLYHIIIRFSISYHCAKI